ncbi:MAG: hypothetical protein GY771_05235, partial [bacterium]|nr:hypothetical protein [bacterium]
LQQGQEKTVTVTGENRGRATLTIEKIELAPNPSKGITFPEGLPKAPITLAPGQTFKFQVNYVKVQEEGTEVDNDKILSQISVSF